MIRHGDERAFGALYDRHTPYLYRLALRLHGGDEAAAADAVHDAWVAAATRFDRFEWRAALRTWLGGFVAHCSRRRFRDPPTLPLTDATLEQEAAPLEARLLAGIEIERALAALPPGAREVLVLHDLEGWTHQQIAEQLGVEVGTSKSQLSRARTLMRDLLTGSESRGGHDAR